MRWRGVRRSGAIALCCCGLAGSAGALQAQVTLVAGIAAAANGAPLAGAELLLPELHRLGRANVLGEVVIGDVPRGRHRVRVRMLGYASADIELDFRGDTVGPVFMLERNATGLDTVHVRATAVPVRLQEYEARRRMGIGRFLIDSVLATEGTRDIREVVQSHIAGVRISYSSRTGDSPRLVSMRTQCGSDMGLSNPAPGGMSSSCNSPFPCFVQVYLDGFPVTEDLDFVRTWDLAGAEYYTGASVPAQYRVRGSACGVLLLWSR